MRILVVGSGAREHALAWKLAQEAEVIAAPGNPGIAEDCECVPVSANDIPGLVDLARAREVDLVVVGPEDPLIAGLADSLREAGIPTFGPGAAGARLEGSKAFSKTLMLAAGVPTADFQTFTDPALARTYARARFDKGRGVVVKASGNALGKGAVVCPTLEEAEETIERMLVRCEMGAAGAEVVIEELLGGREFSLLTLCSEGGIASLPVAQDYKRAHDGDEGPNTGGMGSYSPVPWVSRALVEETEARVVRPILEALADHGILFRGVLFSGLMVDDHGPQCLEYNVRFGDPETQSVIMRLGSGLADSLLGCALGEPPEAPSALPNVAVSVVVASGGYPGNYSKGLRIAISPAAEGAKIFHAGTKIEGGSLVTASGRVTTATAAASDLATARQRAYAAAEGVRFEGAYYRRDIAPTA